MHVIAAKAVALKEALQPSFKEYIRMILENAQAMAEKFMSQGIDLVSRGTDTHLMLLNLTKLGISGRDAEDLLDRVGLTCNKNAIPFDPLPPRITSGIRIGTPAATTRGLGVSECSLLAEWISILLKSSSEKENIQDTLKEKIRSDVTKLCHKFPIYEIY